MKLSIILMVLLSISTPAQEKEKVASAFMKALKKELMIGMRKGPKAGLIHCNDKAMPVTNSFNTEKYEIGRVSLKVRNPKNTPNKDLSNILKEFASSTASSPAKARVVVLPNKEEVYVRPLYMKGACLNCHGTNLSMGLKEELKKRYPQDKATGYKLGEFRGLVWVKEK